MTKNKFFHNIFFPSFSCRFRKKKPSWHIFPSKNGHIRVSRETTLKRKKHFFKIILSKKIKKKHEKKFGVIWRQTPSYDVIWRQMTSGDASNDVIWRHMTSDDVIWRQKDNLISSAVSLNFPSKKDYAMVLFLWFSKIRKSGPCIYPCIYMYLSISEWLTLVNTFIRR